MKLKRWLAQDDNMPTLLFVSFGVLFLLLLISFNAVG